jgi:F-type H+-transporting ATPase subunit b
MQELVTKLGIDWKLLLAQVVNFAILVYILQRFVFKPILAALESRRAGIEKSSKQGEEAALKLQEAEAAKEEILAQARTHSGAIIKEAEVSASKIKDEKIEETKNEVEKLVAQGKVRIESDRIILRSELKKEMGGLISMAVEKTVGDVITTDAQKKLTEEAVAIIKNA